MNDDVKIEVKKLKVLRQVSFLFRLLYKKVAFPLTSREKREKRKIPEALFLAEMAIKASFSNASTE